MGDIRWYKRDPRAAISGMMSLTLEERGAYNTILDLIYINDGALVDDPKTICRWLNCNIRRWKRLRLRLLDCGKLYVHGGCLHNERADNEANIAKRLIKVSAENANKRWATYNEIKDLKHGYPMQPTPTTTNLSYLVPKPKK